MNLTEFSERYAITNLLEIRRVSYLAYYHLVKNGQTEFSIPDVVGWFSQLNLSLPNTSRLKEKLTPKFGFTKGSKNGNYKLHANEISFLKEELRDIPRTTVEVESDGSILPDTLLEGKRDYIQRFGRQINASYSKNLFDACAVLMRRMVEVCLIHTYQNLGMEATIKNGKLYNDLRVIIKDALSNPALHLTSNAQECLDEFRELGNLSAHQLYYNCKREEIDRVKKQFRLLIEELFNKAGRHVEK